MESKFLPPKPVQTRKPFSFMVLVGIFISAFVVILIILNGPTLIKAIVYPFDHTEKKDNETLTQQYRDLYGYERHPEIITTVQKAITIPSPTQYPISGTSNQVAVSAEISIPKINISAPIIQVESTNDAVILTALKKGVVMYPGSVNPGQSGTTVIIGHSSSNLPWTKFSSIFSLLGKLQVNDLIYITSNGIEYTYRIKAVQKGSAQQLIDAGLSGDLIVATCWPIGTDTNRIAVSANLIK